ncbi:MAG TPA: GNAT family N-acetyltransferase [Acidobacteriaceae bacterium]|nr:GNAT family N-acetyltransferase [Acidobacteriaceae bacterium]
MLTIRPATPADIPDMLAFIRELAEYEHEPESALATADDLLRDGFPPPGAGPARFHAFIAEWRESETAAPYPAGFALYFYNYSTWRGHTGIWIEDLFVRPALRGKGIGKALLTRVAQVAVAEGCPRLEWAVLDWNTPAVDFYRSLGAQSMSEWTIMRVSGEALAKLG